MALETATPPATDPAPAPARRRRTRVSGKGRAWDAIFAGLARGSTVLTLLILAALVAVLFESAVPSIRENGAKFLVSSEWRPNEREVQKRDAAGHLVMEDGEVATETLPAEFGALPVIWGTAASSLLALLFAVPIGFGAALFLVRICKPRLGGPLSFLIEFLAAVPSIAYGMWGLMVLAPLLQDHIEPFLRSVLDVPGLHWLFHETIQVGGESITRVLPLSGRDMLCGGLVLGIMILPIVTAISRDVLRAVPREQIEGSLALGATWWQSSWAMLRYSRAGLLGAVLLGLARAAGETMAVTMVIGNNNQIKASIFAPAQTMSSLLANEFAEATTELHRAALIEIALVLLLMSLAFNISARMLVTGGATKSGGRR
ncbi:MAG: phosphate ABC transporter permease subunit PstC [Planctomycetes bacterium]|nr:phosphate ABC transporter permease subunit PstC [Planctomycetota bacterium]